MLSLKCTQNPFMQLRPLIRIETVRRAIFSGDALPMRAIAAYNDV